MKIVLFLTFIASSAFGQNFLPKKDTIIFHKDGSEIRYAVQKHAIYMTTYKDDKWNGPFKAYYSNGKLWSEDNRVNGKIEGRAFEYTPNGDTASIVEWKNGSPYTKIVFYQSTRAKPQNYYFVSKNGFPLLLDGVAKKLDQATPDSLIEEGPDYVYMWLNGEKKLISGKENKYVMITTGDKPGLYRVDGDTKTFSRPMTEGEKKLFLPKIEKK